MQPSAAVPRPELRGAHVLVTGGAGFVGSHLVEALLDGGASVVVVDNLCTGDAANLAHLVDRPACQFITADVCDWTWSGGELDFVYNLAMPASPVHYHRLALETLRVGSEGTGRLLQLAADKGAVFLQASTSEVYGDPLEHPQTETYWGNVNPQGPRSMYDEAKRFSEALCAVWRDQMGAKIRIGRIFNTYGSRMAIGDGRVVPNFVVQALRGEPLTVYGDGTQTRSFCYVDDLVDGLIRLAASDYAQPVNLGNPVENTVREFAELVLELTGSRSTLTFRPLPGDDPLRRQPDIRRAREQLGWEPKTTLRDGLEKTIETFRSRA